jgi:hypothetical protein
MTIHWSKERHKKQISVTIDPDEMHVTIRMPAYKSRWHHDIRITLQTAITLRVGLAEAMREYAKERSKHAD